MYGVSLNEKVYNLRKFNGQDNEGSFLSPAITWHCNLDTPDQLVPTNYVYCPASIIDRNNFAFLDSSFDLSFHSLSPSWMWCENLSSQLLLVSPIYVAFCWQLNFEVFTSSSKLSTWNLNINLSALHIFASNNFWKVITRWVVSNIFNSYTYGHNRLWMQIYSEHHKVYTEWIYQSYVGLNNGLNTLLYWWNIE